MLTAIHLTLRAEVKLGPYPPLSIHSRSASQASQRPNIAQLCKNTNPLPTTCKAPLSAVLSHAAQMRYRLRLPTVLQRFLTRKPASSSARNQLRPSATKLLPFPPSTGRSRQTQYSPSTSTIQAISYALPYTGPCSSSAAYTSLLHCGRV